MAISYLGVSFNTRSKGHKAVAGAAYRAGEKLYDEKYGMEHDFENRHDVQYSRVMLPEGADARFSDREFLWNRVEAVEQRRDSQVAVDYVLALPRELNLEQQIDLARSFAQYHFVDKGLVVDLSIHNKEDGNPHAHLYTTTRRLLGDQFDRLKARDLMPKVRNCFLIPEEEHIWNEKYRAFQESYFKAKGLGLTVDPNHLITRRHEGRINEKNEDHYKKQENKIRHELSVDIALNDPENLLNMLGSQHAVFNEHTVAKTILRYADSQEEFKNAMTRVLGHRDCVALGVGEDGRETYTTRSNYLREAKMADSASSLLLNRSHVVSDTVLESVKSNYTISEEQSSAFSHIALGGDISVLVGRAGTGKSYLMKAAREAWEKEGFDVSGIAVSGIAAKSLSSETGIASSTLFSFKQNYIYGKEHERHSLTSKNILVLDEAGMVDANDMATLVDIAKSSGAKLVLVGDPDQLQPIGVGAPLRALASRIGYASMENIRRQRDAGDRAASMALSKNNVEAAIDHYAGRSAIHLIEDTADNREASYAALINDWFASKDKENPHSQLILAHRNKDVQALNALAREKLIEIGELVKSGSAVSAIRQDREISLELASGDRLLFLRNNSSLNVKNGELATVVSVKGNAIIVRRDGDKSTLTFSTQDYKDFDYGYAATVHKTQGVTLDRAFVYAGGAGWNRHLAYVALTRHRDSVAVYASKQDYADLSDLKTAFGRDEFRDNVLDFPLSYAERRGFDSDSLIGRFIDHVVGVKESVKNAWLFVANYEAYLLNKAQKIRDLSREDRELAKRTATYIDHVRALNRDRSILSKELGKAMYGDARYVDLMTRQVALNREAYTLGENKNRFGGDTSLENVLARNRYSVSSFEKSVIAHKNWLAMERYLDAHEKGFGATRRAQSHAMAKASESFAIFSYACQRRGLQIRDVQRQLREDVKSVDRTRFVSTLAADQKQQLKTFERYLSATNGLKSEWRDIYARDVEPSFGEKWRIQGFTELRDRLAMQIVSNPESYRGALHFYDIDTDKLVKQGEAHSRRDVVKSLERLVSAADRRESAHQVLSDRANYRYVFEQRGDWKEISKLSREHEHTLFLQGLSTDERRAYELVSRYQRARIDSARAWTTYFDLKTKGRKNLDAALKIAREFNERRNQLAYELVVNQESAARFVEKTSIPLADIQKQAKQHHAHIHQLRQKYLKLESKENVKRNIVDVTLRPTATPTTDRKTYDIDAVNRALSELGEDFYSIVLGDQGKRSGSEIRYGNKGSLSVQVRGNHAGRWHSFETDEGGYPLQLLMNTTHGWGLPFKEALEEGARLAGIAPNNVIASDKARENMLEQQHARHASKQKQVDQELLKRQEKIAAARYYWNSAKPIDGTLAEIYLRDVRGLQGDLSAFKYHPRVKDPNTKQYYPGVVVSARNAENEITAVQTILLGQDGRKADKENGLDVIKRSRGVVKGSAVLIHEGKKIDRQQVVIAEGPETAASLITALPDAHIYITLGNISNAAELDWLAEKYHTKQLYFAADNDGAYGKSIEKIREVAQKLHAQHRLECYFTKPNLPGKSVTDKIDFNDVLIEKGVDEVKQQVKHFEKIHVKSLDVLLDEKTIESGFNDLIDEWKRVENHRNPIFKALAEHHDTLSNPQYPDSLKSMAQKAFDTKVETICKDDDYLNDLKKIAPGIAKVIVEQYEKTPGIKVDWLSPKLENEWQALSQSNNKRIKEMLDERNLFKNTNDAKMKEICLLSLNRGVKNLISDKDSLAELLSKAPNLNKQMQQYHDRAKERDRGISK